MKSPESVAPPAPRQAPTPDLPITAAGPVRRERRWSVFALCIVLAVLCALGAVAAVNAASDRTSVLAVARDVPAGEPITERDLVVAEVSGDSALNPVPASERGSIVGERPAVPLKEGSLLTRSQLAAGTGLGDEEQLVGVKVERGRAPADVMMPGDEVLAVTTAAEGEQPTEGEAGAEQDSPISGTVVSVTKPDASGTVVVNLAVATTDGPLLAERAAVGRIALVREPRSS
jgi:hypothetical protein